MSITPDQIKDLREKTNVSVMVCKKALEESGGDMAKAMEILKREGAKVADKKSERELKAGTVGAYMHANNQVGVLVEARAETDFVAKNPDFQEFVHNVAMHVAAMDPQFIKEEDVPEGEKEKAKEFFAKEVAELNKPEDIKAKVLEGKISTYIKERTLYSQPYIKNQDITIGDYVKETIQKFGENVEISRFVRFGISR